MSEQKNPEVEEQTAAPIDGEQTAGQQSDGSTAESSTELSVEEQLQADLEACRAEVEKQKDLYLRNRADNENFRRRMQREKAELSKYANENILREVLPVMDNLQRAVTHAEEQANKNGNSSESDAGDTTLLDGVKMTLGQFATVLEKFNVTPVEAQGQEFDPACHEAMGQLERNDCKPNTVVEVMQGGYMLNGRLLRPALVMVSKAVTVVAEAENEA